MRRFGAGATTAALLVSAGCSFGEEREQRSEPPATVECRETGLRTESSSEGPGPGPPAIYWDRPMGGSGMTFTSIKDAAERLPFRPLSPGTLTPCEILVSRGPPPFLVMRFQDRNLGVFHVSQHKLLVPTASAERRLRARARSCARQGCDGLWSLSRLRDGRAAFLALGTEVAAHNLVFIDHDRRVEVVIQGPPRSFGREHALTVGNAFVDG